MTNSPESSMQNPARWTRPWRIGLLSAYFVVLCTATHWPSTVAPLHENHVDKVLHFLAYGVLAWLIAWALWPSSNIHNSSGASNIKWMLGIWAVAIAYGAADELLQTPVGRSCDFYDWLADAAGAWVGLWVYLRFRSSTP